MRLTLRVINGVSSLQHASFCTGPQHLTSVTSDDIRERFSAIKRLSPVVKKPVAYLADVDGKPSTSKHHGDTVIIGYFTKAYGLEHSAFRDAVEVDRKSIGAH